MNTEQTQQSAIQLVMPRFFIRSFTNDNERAKQYFMVAKSDKCSEALIIRKLVLSENLKLYGGNSKILKQFKEYYLFEQRFSIKIETLKTVMSVLNGA
ncbi:MAG: hypothetical protein PHT30_01720 [Bacilli bacterium]|nr:hypothetical protein [Bacilli bacterium]